MTSIWLTRPVGKPISPLVKVGQVSPPTREFIAAEPFRLVGFIRHVGCPFSENTIKRLRTWADAHSQTAVFVVSHGDEPATRQWLAAIGGLGRIRLVIDPQREIYGLWGIGLSSFLHFAGPKSLLGVLALLPRGIRNRSAAGTRWQRSAMFLLKGERFIWCHVPDSAQEFKLPPEHIIHTQAHSPHEGSGNANL